MEIQQLILNTDSCMTHMTFHVQLYKYVIPSCLGDHVTCGKVKITLHMAS